MSQYLAADNSGKIGPAALWKLAAGAIMREVRDRQRRWTWAWFAERRDERKRYIDVWARNEAGILDPKVGRSFYLGKGHSSYDAHPGCPGTGGSRG